MSRDYTVGDADPTTAVVAVPTAPLVGNVVKVPADADPADVPKAIIELVNSLPKAADLATVAPSDPATTAVVGTSTKAAREDHQHKRELPAPLGVDKGKPVVVNVTGSGYTLGAVPVDLATTAPADLAAAAVVGVGTTSARADHQHKKELPVSVAADKDKILTLDATGLAPVWKATPKELPVSGAANANHVLALDATGLIPQWEAVTTLTELKSAVANEAALPATGNATGDIRVTLDDGNMHVWVAATVTPAVAAHWDKIGPAAANVSMATAAPLDPAAAAAVGTGTKAARDDHQHKAELPAHTATDASKYLAVEVGGAAAWRAPSPSISPLGVHFIDTPTYGFFTVNAVSTTAKVSITNLTNVPAEHRQFFVAGGLFRLPTTYMGTPRTYRIVKDFPAAVWTTADPIPEATWGPHGPDEYFAWEDVAAAVAEGGTQGKYDYAVPEIPVHTGDEYYNKILRVASMDVVRWESPTRFVEQTYTGDWTPTVGEAWAGPWGASTGEVPQVWFSHVYHSPYRALFKAGNVIRITDKHGGGDFYYRIIKDLPDSVFDTVQPVNGWIDAAVYGDPTDYIAWEDITSAAAAHHEAKGGINWAVQGNFSLRTKAPVLPAFTVADAGKTLAINPAGTGLMWK